MVVAAAAILGKFVTAIMVGQSYQNKCGGSCEKSCSGLMNLGAVVPRMNNNYYYYYYYYCVASTRIGTKTNKNTKTPQKKRTRESMSNSQSLNDH